jgi:hypothetical protein
LDTKLPTSAGSNAPIAPNFLGSETDIAFLNSFGMRAAFDGVDLFPPREAAFIRSMAPSRIRVLGTVDPPDGASAVESLIYQCETIKIDGLKLYPPGPDTRGWILDDEKNAYPLFEVLRRHGIKNVCVHKGLPGIFIEEYCHTDDLALAARCFSRPQLYRLPQLVSMGGRARRPR